MYGADFLVYGFLVVMEIFNPSVQVRFPDPHIATYFDVWNLLSLYQVVQFRFAHLEIPGHFWHSHDGVHSRLLI